MKYVYSLFVLMFFFACKQEQKVSPEETLYTIQGKTMGTTYSVKYYGKQNFHTQVDSVLIRLNESLSTYIPTSTISLINQAEKEAKTDAHFIENFNEAKMIYKATNGAFNPAVMPLVNYYGFGFEKYEPNKIDTLKVKELLQLVNFEQFKLKDDSITKQQPKAQLDFSALAKGYGVDVVGEFLKNKGVSSYLVEIGGETVAYGKKPNGKLWTVGIRKPSTDIRDRRTIQQAIPLENEALATSGNYENFKLVEGGTIAHTINPYTGFPQQLNDQILSSTVIAKTCARADGFATAFKVMGFEKSVKVLDQTNGLKVYFIYLDENNELRTWSNFKTSS